MPLGDAGRIYALPTLGKVVPENWLLSELFEYDDGINS